MQQIQANKAIYDDVFSNTHSAFPIYRESVKPLQFYCSCLPASLLVFQRRIIFWLKMLRSDNLVLHTLAGCCRVSIAALSEKYSLGLHSELSTLSTCLVKRQFWLYFSDMCERV